MDEIMFLSDMQTVLGEKFWPTARPQVKKARQAYLNNPLRTFSTQNAAAGQKGRPKPNACEISGLMSFPAYAGFPKPQRGVSIWPGGGSPRYPIPLHSFSPERATDCTKKITQSHGDRRVNNSIKYISLCPSCSSVVIYFYILIDISHILN